MEYNKNLKEVSRVLRKEMTEAEKLLWSIIRKKQLGDFQFYRQKIIGNYIADFYCHKALLVVEVDGSQHYRHEGLEKDQSRDYYMESLGLKVLRLSNIDALTNIEGVKTSILTFLLESTK